MQVTLAVNGEQHVLEIEPRVLLVDLLRVGTVEGLAANGQLNPL